MRLQKQDGGAKIDASAIEESKNETDLKINQQPTETEMTEDGQATGRIAEKTSEAPTSGTKSAKL